MLSDKPSLDELLSYPPDQGPYSTDIEATAIHEAGHAFVATAVGVPVNYIVVFADGRSRFTTLGVTVPVNENPSAAEFAAVGFAGRLAEEVFGKKPNNPVMFDPEIANVALSVSSREEFRFVGKLVLNIILGYQPAIREIADAILAAPVDRGAHVLYGSEIERIAKKHLENRAQ